MTGIINLVINGGINWMSNRDTTELLLTDDMISSGVHTVFSGAVPLACSLAFILTSVAYFTIKILDKPRYFPKVFLLALRNSFFIFGIVVTFAILLQNFAGSIRVSPIQGALISGAIAGIVATVVDYLTKTEMTK